MGRAALGDGPLTAAQGVAAFVKDFCDAFTELFSPVAVRVGYKPRLSGVGLPVLNLPAPETEEDVPFIQSALEQSADVYEGITGMTIGFAMHATVRDNAGRLAQVWLP